MSDKIRKYIVSIVWFFLTLFNVTNIKSKSIFLRKIIIYCHIVRKDLTVSVFPWRAKINTGYKCSLKCPLCPTGLRESPQKDDLTVKMFSFFLEKLKPVKEIYLFGWGEPLLNKDIFEMIRMAKKEGKYIAIDSCLNIANDDKLNKLVESELDFLSISLDGTDQETYSKYRAGGDFDLVFNNIKKIQEIKKKRKTTKPRLQWQYCVNRYNQENMSIAKKMARGLNVGIKFIPIGLYLDCLNKVDAKAANEWLPFKNKRVLAGQNSAETPINDAGYCCLLYCFPFIDVDGYVYFCCPCSVATPKNSIIDDSFAASAGSLKNTDLLEILNNDIYQHARGLFSKKKTKDLGRPMACDVCRRYKKI